MILVVTVIVLVLAIAVPGLSAMNAEARLTAAQQTVQGMTTQAYNLALANRSMTAVRFFPSEWDTADPTQRSSAGRQHLAIYSYVGTMRDDGSLSFGERFERANDLSSAVMPEDVWAAPLEALATYQVKLSDTNYDSLGADFVLNGTANLFKFNADSATSSEPGVFLNADDFLIVCDPQTGIRTAMPAPFRMRAYVPKYSDGSWGYDADTSSTDPTDKTAWYQRYSFSGVVTYRREPFLSLPGGAAAAGADRQAYLRETGRPFLVHRFSGGLLPALQRPQ